MIRSSTFVAPCGVSTTGVKFSRSCKNVFAALGGGNGVNVGARGRDDDAESGKGIERLEDKVFEIGRELGAVDRETMSAAPMDASGREWNIC